MMIIKRSISETTKCGTPSCEIVKKCLNYARIEVRRDKVEILNLLNSFFNTRYDNIGRVKYYILKIVQITTRLREAKYPHNR